MRLLKFLMVATMVVAAAVFVVGLMLPDTVHLERSTRVRARPDTLYAALNSFKRFNEWSPWAKLDPNTLYTFDGPPWGVGAKLTWSSDNPSVGHGSQEIIETQPNRRICSRLVFGGFDSENYSTLTFTPDGDDTRVTWSYDSTFHGNLLGRYFALKLDDWVGQDYERGLANLKRMAEGLQESAQRSSTPIELVEVPQQTLAMLAGQLKADSAATVRDTLVAAYAQLYARLAAHDLKPLDRPLAITHEFEAATRLWRFDTAVAIDGTPPASDAAVRFAPGYHGAALRLRYDGPLDHIESAYAAVIAFRSVAGLADNGDSWERYLSDPALAASGGMQTEIYWPVR